MRSWLRIFLEAVGAAAGGDVDGVGRRERDSHGRARVTGHQQRPSATVLLARERWPLYAYGSVCLPG